MDNKTKASEVITSEIIKIPYEHCSLSFIPLVSEVRMAKTIFSITNIQLDYEIVRVDWEKKITTILPKDDNNWDEGF